MVHITMQPSAIQVILQADCAMTNEVSEKLQANTCRVDPLHLHSKLSTVRYKSCIVEHGGPATIKVKLGEVSLLIELVSDSCDECGREL